ncbi:sensor domain-containing protein [Yunchengibacter salinarum]|uniref:sensor domain-containing protein n=1 Tax=Yunchengibacter salinarum TaxID=3133399 RepID=UPI0035B5B156
MPYSRQAAIANDPWIALREREKELWALEQVLSLIQHHRRPDQNLLNDIVPVLQKAMYDPAHAEASLSVYHISSASSGFDATTHRIDEPLVINGKSAGMVCVGYPSLDDEEDAAFLDEEYKLIQRISRSLESLIGFYNAEARFQAMFESLSVGVAIADMKGRWMSLNPAGERLLGYDQHELAGRQITEITAPEDRPLTHKSLKKGRAGKAENAQYQKKYIRKDGSPVWCDVSWSVVHRPDGKPDYVVAIITNASDRVAAEKRAAHRAKRLETTLATLRAEKERTDMVVSHTGVGLIDYRIQSDRLMVNRQTRIMLNKGSGALGLDDLREKFDGAHLEHLTTTINRICAGQLDEASMELRAQSRPESAGPLWLKLHIRSAGTKKGDKPDRLVGTLIDATKEHLMKERDHVLSAVVEQTSTAILLTDRQGRIEYVNPSFEQITGYSAAEIKGQNTSILSSGLTSNATYEDLWNTITRGEIWHGELINRHADGRLYYVQNQVVPIRDESGQIIKYAGIEEDVTLRREQAARIENLANYDQLTQLPNRTLAMEQLQIELTKARQNHDILALFLIDLDNFKLVNDSSGHPTGDKVLTAIAQRLRQALTGKARVARIGGDEFLIMANAMPGLEEIEALADRLVRQFKLPVHAADQTFKVSASLGVSVYPDDGREADQLVRAADTAMYRAKENGRNQYCFFAEEMAARIDRRVMLEQHLNGALDRNEIQVHYQPFIHLASGEAVGMEALMCWTSDDLGTVRPDEFIPVAESSGAINQLGHFVMRQALHDVASLRAGGNPDLYVAVNVSAQQLWRADFVDEISALLQEADLPGDALEVEVTESLFLGDPTLLEARFQAFRARNIRLSMDDFGTGYSSLGYLRQYPFSSLKIDKSFVRDSSSDATASGLVQAVLSMAHALNLTVVAEGVETEDHVRFLEESHCDLAQGYYYAKPMPFDVLRDVLTRRENRVRNGNASPHKPHITLH